MSAAPRVWVAGNVAEVTAGPTSTAAVPHAVSRPAGSWSVRLDLVGVEANPEVDWLVA